MTKAQRESWRSHAKRDGQEGTYSCTASTPPPRTLTGELINQTLGDGTSSLTPHTHTRCPAHQTLGDVDVQDPQPDGDHNPEPVKLPCVVLAEPRRAPENRGPKFTMRTAGGDESNLKVKSHHLLAFTSSTSMNNSTVIISTALHGIGGWGAKEADFRAGLAASENEAAAGEIPGGGAGGGGGGRPFAGGHAVAVSVAATTYATRWPWRRPKCSWTRPRRARRRSRRARRRPLPRRWSTGAP